MPTMPRGRCARPAVAYPSGALATSLGGGTWGATARSLARGQGRGGRPRRRVGHRQQHRGLRGRGSRGVCGAHDRGAVLGDAPVASLGGGDPGDVSAARGACDRLDLTCLRGAQAGGYDPRAARPSRPPRRAGRHDQFDLSGLRGARGAERWLRHRFYLSGFRSAQGGRYDRLDLTGRPLR